MLEPKYFSIAFGSAIIPLLNDNIFACLLYTSDAADERSSVDLGGRRIIKKQTKKKKRKEIKKKKTKQYTYTSERMSTRNADTTTTHHCQILKKTERKPTHEERT